MLNDKELKELIETLRVVKEDINIIKGMYDKLGCYKDNIIDAQEKLDSALYKLTGDKFYLQDNKKEGGN